MIPIKKSSYLSDMTAVIDCIINPDILDGHFYDLSIMMLRVFVLTIGIHINLAKHHLCEIEVYDCKYKYPYTMFLLKDKNIDLFINIAT